MDLKSKIILISGPTASGKSNFSIKLAKKINGEIINADSMQVYRELSVLTARPQLMMKHKSRIIYTACYPVATFVQPGAGWKWQFEPLMRFMGGGKSLSFVVARGCI